MLSAVSNADGVDYSLAANVGADNSHQTGALLEDDDWLEINQSAATVALGEVTTAELQPADHPPQHAPIPAIPFDDSINPSSNCPELDDEFCLPDSTNNEEFDFLDFLMLNQNFGMDNARWEDGDFNSDGRVSFDDFLLLSSHFGSTA